ncbi:MAG: DUF971 domain-containing protein [Acidobacteria bacterium]|nr:DUF971 domain-containing protein [Acidobacteriota bacterium]
MSPSGPIQVSRSQGLSIRWPDGHVSSYGPQYLRDHCPCAACVSRPAPAAASPFVMLQPALKIAAAEPAGVYALHLEFSDGHNSGFYTFEHLRTICPCAECAARR